MTAAPPPLFHGTRAGFTRGGLVLPQALHQREARPGHDTDGTQYAYATTDPDMAQWYALQAKGRGKPKVLTVIPLGPVENDPSAYTLEHGHQVRCRDGFRVIAVTVIDADADADEDPT